MEHASAAAPEILPAAQSSQLLASLLLAYLPGLQFVQVVDRVVSVYVPFWHSLQLAAALPLNRPVEQSLHVTAVPVLAVPALQAVQVDDPSATPV